MNPFASYCVAAALVVALLFGPLCGSVAYAQEGDSPTAATEQTANESTERKVIRVAFPQQEGLTQTDEDGTRSGYTFEYLEQVAQYTGWEYEFVEVPGDINDSLSALLDMLETGEVDIMGAMMYNDALAEIYDYAINPYGFAHTALFASDDNEDITDTNIYSRSHLKVAMIGPAPSTTKELQTFCDMNAIELEIVRFDTNEALTEAVFSGECDVMIGSDLGPEPGMHLVATLAPRPFYFTTTKGNGEIVAALNSAIAMIDEAEPMLQNELYEKYFKGSEFVYGLSKEMKECVAQSDTLRIGYLVGSAPVQELDPTTGELTGATRAVLDYVADFSGITYEAIPLDGTVSWDQAIEQYDLDMIAGVDRSFDFAHAYDLSLSSAYLQSSAWLVINRSVDAGDLDGKTLAVVRDRSIDFETTGEVIAFDTLEECIKAVDEGTADYTYADGYTGPYYINDSSLKNITTIPETALKTDKCFAFASTMNPVMLQIFNKAIQEMPTGVVNSALYSEITRDQQFLLDRFVDEYAREIVALGLFVALIIIVLSVLYARSRAKAMKIIKVEKERLRVIAERDDLTGLLTVGAFREAARDLIAEEHVGAFVVVDIDNFKSVNDTLGHKMGDEALCVLAEALRETFREEDLLCRFGGDEFAVCMVGDVSLEVLEARCGTLVERVKSISGVHECDFSVSVGAYRARGAERYADLYDRADRAMYEAKHNGKDTFRVV